MHARTLLPLSLTDREAMSPLQILTLILGFFIVAADGFDIASVGYIAPLLLKAWNLSPAQLGPIFGAGLFGLCAGSFLFGPLADRVGRKRVILISLVLFALGSLACASAPSAPWLIFLRFATGLGLGGALPAMVTLASEFSPQRNKSLVVTLMLIGMPFGLALGGLVAAQLIPSFGWKGVFLFGGLFPLCLVPVALFWLPESLKFMTGKPRFAAEAKKVMLRLSNNDDVRLESLVHQFNTVDSSHQSEAGKTPASILFSAYYRVGTLLLWLTFFGTLWVYYQLSSWLPTVITQTGIDVPRAAIMAMMVPLGGVFGAVLNAFLMDRFNPFLILTGSYIIAAVSIALIGFSIHEVMWVYVTTFLAGFGLIGAQAGITVTSSNFYNTAARATGVSWCLAVGRIGSILGAMTGGLLLASIHSVGVAFVIFAVPTIIAGGAMFMIGRLYPNRAR
ncbi:aromatic acid/H+ symport family MFS transporter [Glaciimonas sp. PAMC28666]|uniref:MFS transporter n=1 Tax=Glaciimonas sp. PAMC28666 TaxID=2807626 RepID=UPI001963067F|nr:aromatic acid/H+ symport family MFS transporter [Glaciimonas sp. PAMC28666]QRX81736.1 aromatic acid/H+ symport family MFS transporter [Glaciimonas sp. PAMC28666]